jgi:hypothetical protein
LSASYCQQQHSHIFVFNCLQAIASSNTHIFLFLIVCKLLPAATLTYFCFQLSASYCQQQHSHIFVFNCLQAIASSNTHIFLFLIVCKLLPDS